MDNKKAHDYFEILAIHNQSVADIDALKKELKVLAGRYNGKDLPFPVLLDNERKTVKNFGTTASPSEVLIDPAGHVVRDGDFKMLVRKLDPYMAEHKEIRKKLKSCSSRERLLAYIEKMEKSASLAFPSALIHFMNNKRTTTNMDILSDALIRADFDFAMTYLSGSKGLKSKYSGIRQCALEAIGRSRNRKALDLLIRYLNSDDLDSETVAPALQALLDIAPEGTEVSEVITRFSEDDDVANRAAAVEALGRIDTRDAFERLIGALENDPSASVRAKAATGLGMMKFDERVSILEKARQEDKSRLVQKSAAAALGSCETSPTDG